MKKFSIGLLITSLILISCGKQPAKAPSVEILLKQGPVSAWRIPLTRQGTGNVVCRYIVTGEDKPRECPVDGDSLVLTTVDQDGVLTIVHSAGREGMSASATFKIEHPLPGDVRIEGPYAVTVEPKEKTVWKTTWESPETRKPVFSVEIVAYLRPAT
jgi:hypothetical protein